MWHALPFSLPSCCIPTSSSFTFFLHSLLHSPSHPPTPLHFSFLSTPPILFIPSLNLNLSPSYSLTFLISSLHLYLYLSLSLSCSFTLIIFSLYRSLTISLTPLHSLFPLFIPPLPSYSFTFFISSRHPSHILHSFSPLLYSFTFFISSLHASLTISLLYILLSFRHASIYLLFYPPSLAYLLNFFYAFSSSLSSLPYSSMFFRSSSIPLAVAHLFYL